MNRPVRLCIFARAPVLGEVKQRLARALGARAALAAHEELVGVALRQLASVPGLTSELWIAGAPEHPRVQEWARVWRLAVHAQHGPDLGARMCHAITTCLAEGSWAIVVGTDCPGIDAAYARRAASQLALHDLVLGPAEDGGYGLIGLRARAPQLFADMPWGTPAVLDETLQRARALGLTSHLLDSIRDVDDAADWERYRSGVTS